jgi:hypothetical protein
MSAVEASFRADRQALPPLMPMQMAQSAMPSAALSIKQMPENTRQAGR